MTLLRWLTAACLFLTLGGFASADVVARTLEYKAGDAAMEGALIYDNALKGKLPTVIVAHEQGPTSALAKSKAVAYAKMGYLAFVIDPYGKGATPKDAKEFAAKAGITEKDRKLVRVRMEAGLAALTKQPQCDPKNVSGVGFGWGGTALLELIRTGADLEGVVVVHGDLTSPTPDDAKKISASILVIVGADDPQIPLTQIGAFETEMKKGDIDWQMLRMGGVVHDFTNPQAGRDLKKGSAYDADADARTNEAIKNFLKEMFTPEGPAVPPMKKDVAVPKGIPEKVMKVLSFVDDKGEAMDNYEGGRTFGNYEKRLPQTDDKGKRIRYREWDVNPLKPGVNRGAERLVTGSDGAAYFTDDHYNSFKKIR